MDETESYSLGIRDFVQKQIHLEQNINYRSVSQGLKQCFQESIVSVTRMCFFSYVIPNNPNKLFLETNKYPHGIRQNACIFIDF